MYSLEFTLSAIEDLKWLKKTDQNAYIKVQKLLLELTEHPTTGTGKPELKKYNLSGLYSRRITQKHRLVYQINGVTVSVLVLSAAGHYDDK
ncbi:Txe/YoeB family addiction module toxin [Pedobacter miscanthi]|jgi:toxin YoeB|uniref:Txe/YoeB family addiction module toxin n=1 Tax=Pedobacter miscanthi TaxID=2259170 RepID=UPI00292EBAC6|nr:Txe/YoeB family addiction module toxin [Pedobacter miscanthi]